MNRSLGAEWVEAQMDGPQRPPAQSSRSAPLAEPASTSLPSASNSLSALLGDAGAELCAQKAQWKAFSEEEGAPSRLQ